MRIAETCTCGASIEVEHDDATQAATAVDTWRARHRCGGVQPWRRSEQSTVASDLAFGFDNMQPREDEVVA